VDETQKAKIKMLLAASNLMLSLILFTVLSLLLLMTHSVLPKIPLVSNDFLPAFLLCGLFVVVLHNLYHCFALRRLLKNSPRTTEQIKFADRLETVAAMYSVWHLKFDVVFFLVVFLSILFFTVYQAVVANVWDVFRYLGLAVLGWATIYFAVLLRVKLGQSGRNL